MNATWPTFSPGEDPLDTLVKLSRYYGADPQFVLAGGGNTSVKMGDRLLVKASGTSLASIEREGFVAMDRPALERLAHTDLSSDPREREVQFKAAIMAAVLPPSAPGASAAPRRPSVECLLHHLLPGRYVLHTHPTIVNALTCCVRGEALAREWFGEEILWQPYVDPGYTLARSLQQGLQAYRERTGRAAPPAILMASHGLLVGTDDPLQLRERTERLLEKIAARLGAQDPAPPPRPDAAALVGRLAPVLRALLAEDPAGPLSCVTFDDSGDVLRLVSGEAGRRAALGGPLTPDQIVYCNSYPLWFEVVAGEEDPARIARLREALAAQRARTGQAVKVVLVGGLGLFAAGRDLKGAETVRSVYLDAIRVMDGAARLGGIRCLSDSQRRFIEDWEVEQYRKGIAAAGLQGRVSGRIAVITGGAQGFGLELAQGLAAEGGQVVLADINVEGARREAAAICRLRGAGRALGLAINVADEASVEACLAQVVRTYGGFDVLVSNAGVLRSGSVKSQPVSEFAFVTEVNYKGYFVCVQKAAPILALQHRANPVYHGDIIQINSKSGLAGSNKNGAYAGSKFGGIGLTQSFALELIEDGIKVNAICPGNFFSGPLWSDPENGLFAQYLRAGKVPGARTVEDVRKAYEAKVPMGRGCTAADVLKALFYLIEQQYETGQALPVTGGQVMLS